MSVVDHAVETINQQKSKDVRSEVSFLDSATAKFLSESMYNKERDRKYLGIIDTIFPSDFTEQMRKQERNVSVPSIHTTEFLIQGNEESEVAVEFHFLQPKIRRLLQKREGTYVNLRTGIVVANQKSYQAGNEEPVKKVKKIKKFTIAELLNKKHHQSFSEKKEEVTDEIIEKGNIVGKYVYEVPQLIMHIYISCNKIPNEDNIYKISIKVLNNERIKTHLKRKLYDADEVMKKSWYGCYTIANCFNCTLLDTTSEESLKYCVNLNTFPIISCKQESQIFSSPVIVHDSPQLIPLESSVSLDEIKKHPEKIFSYFSLLDEKDIQTLKAIDEENHFSSVFLSLSLSLGKKISFIHKFQWDAIQKFIKKIIQNNSSPLVIRAPTGSGKSLIFYVCAVLMKILNKKLNGTITFITFPTRALNTQQFNEMIKFFHHLNKNGVKITLGLYMGKDTRAAVKPIDPFIINEGDQINIIESCPECYHDKIIAKKPSSDRILPVCEKCNSALDYLFLSSAESERYCPNVLVGTPDKLIHSLTHNVYSHTIFGAPVYKCPTCKICHPLCMKDQNDPDITCRSCKTTITSNNKTASTPKFIVFDEIHTLSGTQGNLLSHFLSLLQTVKQEYGLNEKFWHLGASATVANQEELVHNLTGVEHTSIELFPDKSSYLSTDLTNGYFQKSSNLRHRYIILEPLRVSTRGSVPRIVNTLFSFLNSTDEINDEIRNSLNEKHIDIHENFGTQTVYVLKKDDGREMEKYIPDNANKELGKRPKIKFGSGDLAGHELAQLNKLVKEHKLDVFVVTNIYGQGVDFPGLNIIHFFGTPKSFVELSQVVGRTGRGKVPGLVIVHLLPHMPRDQWVYQYFRYMIKDLEGHYEPTPINFSNKYAISLSIPNVLHSLLLTLCYKDHFMRYGRNASATLLNNKEAFLEIIDKAVSVYDRKQFSKTELQKLKNDIFKKLSQILLEFKSSDTDTRTVLVNKDLLIGTLRGKTKNVTYTEDIQSPVLNQLSASGEIEGD